MSRSTHETTLSQSLGLLFARVPLGAYLLLVGYQQWHGGLGRFASENNSVLGRLVSPAVAGGILRSVPVAEVAAGAFLILGIFSRTGGVLASVTLAVLLVAAGQQNLGATGNMPFSPLLILCGFALYLGVSGAGGLSLDRLVWGKGKHG
jgi:uncharacterized membrane protein YphA (DoxX/SURF4 family)